MNICPCCKRAVPVAKTMQDKRLTQDLERVAFAISVCEDALTNPFFANITEAVRQERTRLNLALTDHRLLWTLYRRSDKKEPYFENASELIAA